MKLQLSEFAEMLVYKLNSNNNSQLNVLYSMKYIILNKIFTDSKVSQSYCYTATYASNHKINQ